MFNLCKHQCHFYSFIVELPLYLAGRVTNHPHVGSADPNPRALHNYLSTTLAGIISVISSKGNTPISKYLVLIWINILSGILMTDARVGELGVDREI